MQQQPDKPATTPTPEDPRERTPVQDPPVQPEHDDGGNPTRIANAPGSKPPRNEETVRGYQSNDDESSELEADDPAGSIRADNPSPDRTVFDENRSGR
jgi:hypothetical protein